MSEEPQTNFEANRLYLIGIRERLGMTQERLALRLGMGLRAYSDLETGKSKTRSIHVMAAERLSLQEAKLREDPALAAPSILQEVRALVARSGG